MNQHPLTHSIPNSMPMGCLYERLWWSFVQCSWEVKLETCSYVRMQDMSMPLCLCEFSFETGGELPIQCMNCQTGSCTKVCDRWHCSGWLRARRLLYLQLVLVAMCFDVLWRASGYTRSTGCYRSLISSTRTASPLSGIRALRDGPEGSCAYFLFGSPVLQDVVCWLVVPWTDRWLPWKRQNMGKLTTSTQLSVTRSILSCLQIYECKII